MTDEQIKMVLADSVITVQSYIFGKIVEEQMTVAELIKRYTKTGEVPYVDPVKHGHWNAYIGSSGNKKYWLRNDGSPIFLRCDQCHRIVVSNGSSTWNYCPNCGAKMDEDGD